MPHNYSIEEQENIFSEFWNRFSAQIISGDGVADSELTSRHITTIIRLPVNVATTISNECKDIGLFDYHYPTQDIHLTLINLDKLLGNHKDVDWDKLGRRISDEIENLPHMKFSVKGIGVFPTTVFAQVYDTNSMLELYRVSIIKGVKSYLAMDDTTDEIRAVVPGATFANIVRFKDKPDSKLVESIRKMHGYDFGESDPVSFEVVTTDRLLSKGGTIVHNIIKLQ
ncbi:MAG TPA: hypothetical protein VLG36_00395 [Candidatus Chromulinivoraceae bacterium]|nr:hypothetical protein [Candidatus Chromulinivoraceae bacterium]